MRNTRKIGATLSAGLLMLLAGSALAKQPAIGDVVWAQWKPNAWYHGKVDKACPQGLHVAFDDGDQACMPASLMAVDKAPATADLKVGMRVLGLWNGKHFPGVVARIVATAVHVRFDDHDQRTMTALETRILADGPSRPKVPGPGDTVWAQWKPNAFYHGKVAKTCDYGLFIQFDDGDKGCIPTAHVAVDVAPPADLLTAGARVLAKWSDGRLYPATVTGNRGGAGAVSVQFDDRAQGGSNIADVRLLGF